MPGDKGLSHRVTNLEKAVRKLGQLANAQRKQDYKSPEGKPDTKQEHERAEFEAPISPNVTPAPKDAETSKDKWYKTAYRRMVRFIWNFQFLEGLGVIAVIAYAGLTYSQWRDLQRHFMVEQRAWLKADIAIPPRGFNITGTVGGITNVGKSPAFHAVMQSAFQIIDNDKGASFNYPPEPRAFFPIIFPSDRSAVYFLEQGAVNARSLTPREKEGLEQGSFCVVIFGRIVYDDQFGTHWTQFCAWNYYGPPGAHTCQTGSCVKYGAVGDGIPRSSPDAHTPPQGQ
jgi:hypothetical protein